MRRPLISAFVLLAVGSGAAQAQVLPFDMTPERPASSELDIGAQTARPAPVTPGNSTRPSGGFRRYLLPGGDLKLPGENADRAWSIYLTPQQAAAGAKLNLGYQNAILDAPELSSLSVEINNVAITKEAIRSPESISELNLALEKNVLKAGENLIRLRASQRHRTDCSAASTYELWTDLESEKTYLSFDDNAARVLTNLDDIRAIGTDENGLSRFEFIVPALEQPSTTMPLMRLAQGLALRAGMPNQSFTFTRPGALASDAAPADAPLSDQAGSSGRLTVLVGTATELGPLLPTLPAAAASTPVAGFADEPVTGSSVLFLSGPDWPAVRIAIDSIVGETDNVMPARRDSIVTQRWRAPDAPFLFSDSRIPFSRLGLRTEEFSGRRFRTDFAIGVPADFYADAYGEAVLLLDAAYSAAVLPGSHIDIYVNGSVAATVPINAEGGGILRHLPISVTMRHFRPGLNVIAIEAVLETHEDKACVPGTTGSPVARFALFDTSELHMPDFARIGQLPNLSAAAGTGFPYGRIRQPIPLFIDRIDTSTLSAAATFLGKLAVAAGHPIAVETVASPAMIGNRNALFVGALSGMPQMVFSQMNIAVDSRATWGTAPRGQAPEIDTPAAFDQWRQKLRGGSWRGQINALEDWMQRNFDISLASLRFASRSEPSFTPSRESSLLVSQSTSPDGSGTWTVVAAPTTKDLEEGMRALSVQQNWNQLAGRISTYQSGAATIRSVPVNAFEFMSTQPVSLANYRLIAANWLSTNILSYAGLLAAVAVILGLATAGLLGNLGRRG